jgi:hypothetical protein
MTDAAGTVAMDEVMIAMVDGEDSDPVAGVTSARK